MLRSTGFVRLLATVMPLLMAASGITATVDAQSPREAAVAPGVVREIHKLERQFRSGRNSPEKRVTSVRRLLQLGPPGAAALREMVRIEISPNVGEYAQKLADMTARGSARRAIDATKVDEARNMIGGLLADKGLTKERIKAEGDPALDQLRSLIEPRVESAIVGSESLVKLRIPIAQALEIVSACDNVMASERQESSDPPSPDEPPPDGIGDESSRGDSHFAESTGSAVCGDSENGASSISLRLAAIEMDAITMAITTSAADKRTLESNAQLAARFDSAEVNSIARLNRIRVLVGLSPLKIDAKLMQCARGHATDMVKHKFFSHTSPLPGKKNYGDRAKLVGATAYNENIYFGSSDPQGPIDAWWHSPGHFKNMLSGTSRVGLGRYKGHWTMNGGK